MLALLIGFWMLQDFHRIGYTSRRRYAYLILCMLVQPLLFVYLLRTRELRRAAGKPVLFTQRTVPIVVLCLLLWHQYLSSFPIAELRKAGYKPAPTASEAEERAAQARDFLRAAGMEAADFEWMDGNTVLYLQENLEPTARLLSKGHTREYGAGSSLTWETGEDSGPELLINTYLFYIRKTKQDKNLYAAVTCFSWKGKSALQKGKFTIQLADGFEMEGRNGFFRLWADSGKKSWYRDSSLCDIGIDSNSFPFLGKSLLRKYAWHGCSVTYFRGQEFPEYVTLTFRQTSSSPSGRDLFKFSGDIRFKER